jgi:hypothetical protein
VTKTFPVLREGQVAVARAELETGYLLGRDGKRDLGEGDPYLVFDSLSDARAFAKEATRTTPGIECVVLRAPDDVIEVHRMEPGPARKRRGWRFRA